MVYASRNVASTSRLAALPVGDNSMYGTPRRSRSSTRTRMLVVLPTPGPPLMIETWRLSAVAIARRCSASSTISLAFSARWSAYSSLSALKSGALTANSCARRSAAEHSSSYSSRPYTCASSAVESREVPGSTQASSVAVNTGRGAQRGHQLGVRLPAAGGGTPLVELAGRAVDELRQRQVHVTLGPSNQGEHVFQRGMQAER